MKAFLALLILPAFSLAQEIPIKSNRIIASGVGYKQVVNAILDNNFRIKEKDETFQTATLESMDHPNLNIEIRIKDSICYFKESLSSYGVYYATKGDAPAFRKAFEIMDKIAKSITEKITYAKL